MSSRNKMTLSVCMYSNSRNDVPRVAQRYGTIAAHTRPRASVLKNDTEVVNPPFIVPFLSLSRFITDRTMETLKGNENIRTSDPVISLNFCHRK